MEAYSLVRLVMWHCVATGFGQAEREAWRFSTPDGDEGGLSSVVVMDGQTGRDGLHQRRCKRDLGLMSELKKMEDLNLLSFYAWKWEGWYCYLEKWAR